jgi:hypothetical protein
MTTLQERMVSVRDRLAAAYQAAEAGGVLGKKIPA